MRTLLPAFIMKPQRLQRASSAKDAKLCAAIVEQIRDRTGFSTLRLHDLRHTYASHAASLSETLPMIGKLLGHAEVRSTARYTHLDDADVLRTAGEVDGVIAQFICGVARRANTRAYCPLGSPTANHLARFASNEAGFSYHLATEPIAPS